MSLFNYCHLQSGPLCFFSLLIVIITTSFVIFACNWFLAVISWFSCSWLVCLNFVLIFMCFLKVWKSFFWTDVDYIEIVLRSHPSSLIAWFNLFLILYFSYSSYVLISLLLFNHSRYIISTFVKFYLRNELLHYCRAFSVFKKDLQGRRNFCNFL